MALFKITHILDQPNLSLEQILSETAMVIPSFWQQSDLISARITLENIEYKSPNFRISQWNVSEIISTNNKPNGLIELFFHEQKPQESEEPLPKEKKELLKVIAARLGNIVAQKLLEVEFFAVFKESTVSKCIIDLNNGNQFVDVNEIFTEFSGYSREELIGNPPYKLGLFKDEKIFNQMLELIKTHGVIKNFAFEYIRKDGQIAAAIMDSQYICFYGQNFILSSFFDLTEVLTLKKAETEANELNKILVESIPMALEIISESGVILYANDIMKKQFGNDLVDKSFRKPDLKGKMPCTVFPVGKGSDPGETFVYTSDEIAPNRVYEISLTGFYFKGEKTYLKLMNDITDRKSAERELIEAKEKAEESDLLKTAFLNNISHEIRTPLNAIMGFSELLGNSSYDPEKKKKLIDIIISSGVQLLNIVDDILAISRIEVGQETIEKEDINVNVLGNQIYSHFQVKASKQRIDFKFKPELPNNDAFINTDKTKLFQVLSNLISNAFKFTQHGTVEFGYKVDNHIVVFYVRDTGIGIPPNMLDDIFKRFRQVENSENRQFGGSGLGLSISKAYVELLGGSIWVTSIQGMGSTFYFTIPKRHYVEAEIPVKTQPSHQKIKIIPKGLLILIAEDEESNFILLEEMLSEFEPNIVWAKNGSEAVAYCKTTPKIDLILMDLKMPIMDGFEATRQIRVILPHVPILAQSAFSTIEDVNSALEAGCNDLLSKPITQGTLLLKLNPLIK